MTTSNSLYPRELTPRERSWIDWILPVDRPGYRKYRETVAKMVVLGPGRRGKGDLVLGHPGDEPDTTSPLPPVFAYGVIETNVGMISISLRENVGDQIDLEIVNHRSDEVPDTFAERWRWTYSTWNPGEPCPQCMKPIREVRMQTEGGGGERRLVLAICSHDHRLWIHDGQTGVNHLIPITNFYNELMMYKNIRDPKIAFDCKRLFSELDTFSDADLMHAFLTYNKLKSRVGYVAGLVAERGKAKRVTWIAKLGHMFKKRKVWPT